MFRIDSAGRVTRSVVVGLLCAVVSVPIASVALETYVTLTISVGDTRLISRLINAALVVIALTNFGSGFVATYVAQSSRAD